MARAFNDEMEELGRYERGSHSGFSGLVQSKAYQGIAFHGADESERVGGRLVRGAGPGKAPAHTA